jgi:hypothetical protein
MRTLSKPSTAKCTLEHYTAFLLAEPQSAGCVRLAEVAGGAFAHDAANRFLNREAFSGKDLFEEARPLLDLEGGALSVDDTVLDKPYSQEGKTELVGYLWSGKHGPRGQGRLPGDAVVHRPPRGKPARQLPPGGQGRGQDQK